MRGFCFALLLGLGMGILARFLELGSTDQLRMRGQPNTLDLGIAFVAGIAASYCIARPKLSGTLAGVTIAAALVPPIATVGICLALGETATVKGAALPSRITRSSELEIAVKSELPAGVKLVSVSRRPGGGFEVTLESPSPLSDEILAKVKGAIDEKENRETKVRLRTHLVREK